MNPEYMALWYVSSRLCGTCWVGQAVKMLNVGLWLHFNKTQLNKYILIGCSVFKNTRVGDPLERVRLGFEGPSIISKLDFSH